MSCLLTKVKELQRPIRLYREIENKHHCLLDVVFFEDASLNFSMLSKIALNLLKNEISERQGIKEKKSKRSIQNSCNKRVSLP